MESNERAMKRREETAYALRLELIFLRTCLMLTGAIYGLSRLLFWVTRLIPLYR